MRIGDASINRYAAMMARALFLIINHLSNKWGDAGPPIRISWTKRQIDSAVKILDLIDSGDAEDGLWSNALHEAYLSLFFTAARNGSHQALENPIPILPMLVNLEPLDGSWGEFLKLSGTASALIFGMRLVAARHVVKTTDDCALPTVKPDDDDPVFR